MVRSDGMRVALAISAWTRYRCPSTTSTSFSSGVSQYRRGGWVTAPCSASGHSPSGPITYSSSTCSRPTHCDPTGSTGSAAGQRPAVRDQQGDEPDGDQPCIGGEPSPPQHQVT